MARKLRYNEEEGGMAKAQLMKIENYAAKLNDMINPDDELEAWVQSKLSVIAAYMGDIKHYLDYELKQFADGGGVSFKPKEFEIEFTWDKSDEDFDSRTVNVMADGGMFGKYPNGSPYDRGHSDAYYGRQKSPHKYPEGTNKGERIELTDPVEIEEYLAGYNECTDFKDWGDYAKGGVMAKGGNVAIKNPDAMRKAAAIRKAVEISKKAYENNIKASDLSFEEFAEKVFLATNISYGKADLKLAYYSMQQANFADGGKINYSYTNSLGWTVYKNGKALETFKTEEQAKKFIKEVSEGKWHYSDGGRPQMAKGAEVADAKFKVSYELNGEKREKIFDNKEVLVFEKRRIY
jgi:hypothetical protein